MANEIMEPYIYSGAVNGVLSLLESGRWNIPRDTLLKVSDLSEEDLEDEDHHIPLAAFAIILEEAARISNNNALTFELVEYFEKYATSLIHYTFRNSPSVREALHVAARYAGLIMSLRSIEFTENDDTSCFRWNYWKSLGGLQQVPIWAPARVVVMLKSALGEKWKPEQVSFEHAAPENLDPYINIFGSDLLFNQPENYIKLRREDLDKKMPSGDEKLWKYLIDLSDQALAEQQNQPPVVLSVQKYIVEALPRDKANIKSISSQMARSPRTLQRELQAAGTSFSMILEQTRQDLAEKYLLDTSLHISQIAFLLGFSEVSVFSRAVNRWFGSSPSSYRQAQQEKSRQA